MTLSRSRPTIPCHESDEDVALLTDSAIFAVTTLVGSDLLDPRSIDLGASRMDERQFRLAASVFSNARDGIMITDAGGLEAMRDLREIAAKAPAS